MRETDFIFIPVYPPEPVEGGVHALRMNESMVSNAFRYVEDERLLTDLRYFLKSRIITVCDLQSLRLILNIF